MSEIINKLKILDILDKTKKPSQSQVEAVLAKSMSLGRLSLEETAILLNSDDPHTYKTILETAFKLKNMIYGNRIVFFAPLYISNYCTNDCLYCAFRVKNKITRNALNEREIHAETRLLLDQGHKRVLLVAGESYPHGKGLDYILDSIDTVYSVKHNMSSIRRINVNIAPLGVEDFKRLKAKNIGTYQIFQETYEPETYAYVHPSGPKSDYRFRLEAIDRAFEAGFDDAGIGVLFGLADWKFEILAMLQHIEHLEAKFSMGPHTISVPRIEPAIGSDLSFHPPAPVSDEDFKKLVAILRLAVPYTGIILSTRENPDIRRQVLNLGVSQISAGSRTNPGGYAKSETEHSEPNSTALANADTVSAKLDIAAAVIKTGISAEQFSLGDHRTLDEVIYDILQMGFLPSFCTACYRLGRTGLDFMEYAKPGDIRKKCDPNGLLTFKEYLCDYASEKVKELGEKKLIEWVAEIDNPTTKRFVEKGLKKIEDGERDIYI
ncbi:[FeFe] hydrogenase H-cluster radical SAM maturase HydG [Thermoproteota archaeon]